MKASNTEIYNAIEFGGTFFSEHQKEELTLAIQRAESDPMEIVSVGRQFIAMAYAEIERERSRSSQFYKEAFTAVCQPVKFPEIRYTLDEKGIDEVDALRCGGVL